MDTGNVQQGNLDCKYLLEDKFCRAIVNGKEGSNAKLGNVTYDQANLFPNQPFTGRIGVIAGENEGAILRGKFCTHEFKNYCCYICNNREVCEIGCIFLDKPEDVAKLRVSREIRKTQKAIEELAIFLAKGKISEESYLNSVRTLEKRIQNLKAAKQNPKPNGSEQRRNYENEDDYGEKPTSLWYLVPFLFGIIGGIVGYIGTENKDKDMAQSLLVFGILWTLFIFFLGAIAL